MQLTGFHHLTAVTADAPGNLRFYTGVLGLRLVKKTVNQDDVSAYHLFYADGKASPGTDITFFDWPAPPERRGSRSVIRTGLRVPAGSSIDWWRQRLDGAGVKTGKIQSVEGRRTLHLEDPEGQRLALVEDDTPGAGNPWERSPVPAEHQIRGLGPITLSVPAIGPTERVLTTLMNMRRKEGSSNKSGDGSLHAFQMGAGGAAAELHVVEQPQLSMGRQGAGGVHHVAFRVPTVEEYKAWAERLGEAGMANSGPVNRYYFQSLYFREHGGILFELATDEPGFAVDEPMETLGEKLALPPFLEGRRAEIEAGLRPL
jgi:glyoxalase family protein